MADDVAIMYAGRIIERAPAGELFKNRVHPYTQGLFESLPTLDKRIQGKLATIEGVVPPATHFPEGCRFHPRCSKAMAVCAAEAPEAVRVSELHETACWLQDSAVLRDAERSAPLKEEVPP